MSLMMRHPCLSVKARMPHTRKPGIGRLLDMPHVVLADNLARLMAHSLDMKSQRAVAKRAEMDQRTVGRILNQEHSQNLEQIAKLAEAFDLMPWQMLVPDLDPKDPPTIQLSRTEAEMYTRLVKTASEFGNLSDR